MLAGKCSSKVAVEWGDIAKIEKARPDSGLNELFK